MKPNRQVSGGWYLEPQLNRRDLRHTYASWMLENPEMALTTVRDLLGHSSLEVTSKYGHMKSDTFEAVNRTLGGDKSGDSIAVRH